MKAEIVFTFDLPEEQQVMDEIVSAGRAHSAIHEALRIIRQRVKYGNDTTQVELLALEELRGVLSEASPSE